MKIINQHYIGQYVQEHTGKQPLSITIETAVYALGGKYKEPGVLHVYNETEYDYTLTDKNKRILRSGKETEIPCTKARYDAIIKERNEAILDSKIINCPEEAKKAIMACRLQGKKETVPNITIECLAALAPIEETDDIPVTVRPENKTFLLKNPFPIDLGIVRLSEHGGLLYATRLWPESEIPTKFFGKRIVSMVEEEIARGNAKANAHAVKEKTA